MVLCDECQGYLNPALAVDACVRNGESILLVQRKFPPSAGSWVLPGGFVDQGERPEEAVLRELKEEAGLQEPIHNYSWLWETQIEIRGSTSLASSMK